MNKIFIDEKKIEKFIRIISINLSLYDNNSILFDDKKLEEETFYLFINNNVYSLTIIPSYIQLTKNENKIKIRKIISKGLWLTLYEHNFKNWDSICLAYLTSFQKFRQIQYSAIKFNSNQIINLNLDYLNDSNNYIPKINNSDKIIYFYNYIVENDKNINTFIFMTLYLYSLDQIYSKHQYKLLFNLEQTKILLNLNKDNINLVSLLYKCSSENEKHNGITLNFPLIKAIKPEKIKIYFSQNKMINKKSNKLIKNYKFIYKRGLNIKLNLPEIEIYDIDINRIIKKNFEIEEEILNGILEMNSSEWLKNFGACAIEKYKLDDTKLKNQNKFILRTNTTTHTIKVNNLINENFILNKVILPNSPIKKVGSNLRGTLNRKSFNIQNFKI